MSHVTRAYSTFEVKAINDDLRIVTGIASTPSADRADDIVEPKGAQFKLPIPLLWQHNAKAPVGHVTAAKVSSTEIEVTCQFVQVAEPLSLKDELDRAWASVKSGLVRGLSIGFNPLEHMEIEGSWGRKYTKWDWLELSVVTMACNTDCSITSIKSADMRILNALGLTRKSTVRLNPINSKLITTNAQAATGQLRKGVVRLLDPPGASGFYQK